MNLDTDAQRHLRALLRLLGENPAELNSVTFNLNKETVTFSRKKGGGVSDTSQKKEGWVYTEMPGVGLLHHPPGVLPDGDWEQ